MNSIQNEIKTVLVQLQTHWARFGKIIQSIETVDGFPHFLALYRGSASHDWSGAPEVERDSRIQLIVAFFHELFEQFSGFTQIDGQHLEALEKGLNTSLYYSFFSNDRNFQFRTFIHFLGVESFDFSIDFRDVSIRFWVNEFGFALSLDDNFRAFPRRFSLANVCKVNCYDGQLQISPDKMQDAVNRIQVIQREFFLLIDEWEHLNSILAVEQFALRKLASGDSDKTKEKLALINAKRDGLAQWCIDSTAGIQEFIYQLNRIENPTADLVAEIEALDALVLSGVQKYLLPASVSRHVYTPAVLQELIRWVKARKQVESDDLYLQFAEISFSLALELEPESNRVESLLNGRSSDWVLSADPSTPVKAVAWGLTPREHRYLTTALIVALELKTRPQNLDSYWLHAIASVIEIPNTFPCEITKRATFTTFEFVPDTLTHRAIQAMERASQFAQGEELRAAKYIMEYLQSPEGKG